MIRSGAVGSMNGRPNAGFDVWIGSLCKVRDYAKGGVIWLANRCRMVARHRLALAIIAGSSGSRPTFRVYVGAGAFYAGFGVWLESRSFGGRSAQT